MKVLFLILLLGILGWMVHERQFESAVLKKAGRVNESNLPPDSEIIATTALSPEPPPSPRPRGRIASGMAGYKYLSYEPPAYQTTHGTWPLIIFLHGACPDDRLEKLKYFGPIKYGLSHVDFPFLVVAPATSNGWHLQRVEALWRGIEHRYPNVDPRRVYLTGYSMGGHATWMLAGAWPQRFAAIAVVAGAGDPAQARSTLWRTPAWVIHGERDEVVPVQYGKSMAAALASAGGEVKYTFIPNCGHESWRPAYGQAELYQWFLAHEKGPLNRTARNH